MPSSSFSRRRFLGTSLVAGAGALGLRGMGGEAWASAVMQRGAAGVTTAPPTPPAIQTFVSRPDLTPPGVSIVQRTDVAAIADQPQYIFLTPRPPAGTSQPASSQGLMIMDLAGNLVWWNELTASSVSTNPFNLRVQTFQGSPVLTWYEGNPSDGFGQDGTAFIADGDYNVFQTVTTDLYDGLDLHEFLITPQNTALVTAYETGTGGTVFGHALELDIPNSGTTTPLFDWSSQGHVPVSASYVDTDDYFHMNSIDLWPGSARNVLVSGRNTWTVYLIDRQTKDIIWQIGGKASSFTMGAGTLFEYQHDARPLSDGTGISLFDDATQPAPEKRSWGKVFTVDEDAATVSLRHEYDYPYAPVDAGSQGNNQLLPTGGHFVGWGSYPAFTLFGASGSAVVPPVLLDGVLPTGFSNYRAFMYDWTATPSPAEMAIVVRADAGTGNFTAYLSWNGATEIASWRINAGTSTNPVDLPTIKRQTKTGFETVIGFSRTGATEFQGVALDVDGEVLGRTAVVRAS